MTKRKHGKCVSQNIIGVSMKKCLFPTNFWCWVNKESGGALLFKVSSWKCHDCHGRNSIFLYSKLQEVCGPISVLQRKFKSPVLSSLCSHKKIPKKQKTSFPLFSLSTQLNRTIQWQTSKPSMCGYWKCHVTCNNCCRD